MPLTRRHFLAASALVSASSAIGCVTGRSGSLRSKKGPPRLIVTPNASPIILAAARDASRLLSVAIGQAVPLVVGEKATATDWQLMVAEGPAEKVDKKPGAFAIIAQKSQPLSIVGYDAEGVRNGLYQLLERLGFGFFRDGASLPLLNVNALTHWKESFEGSPRFLSRGEMFWDFYTGLRSMCPATWGEEEWENVLLFLARNGHNFCEFYPPMEAIMGLAFPGLASVNTGVVWSAGAKIALTKRVLNRGRELGIRFMYVLVYGHFPSAVRAHFPDLQWRGEFLCGPGEALSDLAGTVWSKLIETLGTDHIYALRHRGEDGQSYSNPCRDLSKIDGHIEGIETLENSDPQAKITIWTWGEEASLHEALPPHIRAVHIRYGVGDVFTSNPIGREMADGSPKLTVPRPWLSAQFTVFGGQETLIRTAWGAAKDLAQDARASAKDPLCEGYFHWPEWSNTSPWMSHVIAKLAWDPESFDADSALPHYAKIRHGHHSTAFLSAFSPLIAGGNAPLMSTPRTRLLLPYVLSSLEIQLLKDTRGGLAEALKALKGEVSSLLARDLGDVLIWLALKQAQALETAAWLAHREGDTEKRRIFSQDAISTWHMLSTYLQELPRWSLLATAREMAKERPLNEEAAAHFKHQGLAFYGGYPSTVSAETIADYVLPESEHLATFFEDAEKLGNIATLEEAGWYWRSKNANAWNELARKIPELDAEEFEKGIEGQLKLIFSEAKSGPFEAERPLEGSDVLELNQLAPESEVQALGDAVSGLVGVDLPDGFDLPPNF